MNSRDYTVAVLIGAFVTCLVFGFGYLYIENVRVKARLSDVEQAWVEFSAVVQSNIQQAETVSRKSACINNLRILDGAIQQWALETKQPVDAVVSTYEIQRYGAANVKCPDGGVYSFGTVDDLPTCSVPDHAIQSLTAEL